MSNPEQDQPVSRIDVHSPPAWRRRLLWLIVLFAVQLLYIPINRMVQGGVLLSTPWDALIPLQPVWAIPYLLGMAWWVGCFLWAVWKMDDDLYRAFVVSMLTVMLFSYAVYLLYPTYVERPTLQGDDWLTALMRLIYSSDRVYNAFPSGHTYTTVLIGLFWWRWYPRWRWLWVLISVVIVLSTLFTRQHYLPDLLGGTALATAGYGFGLWWAARSSKDLAKEGPGLRLAGSPWWWGLWALGLLVSVGILVFYAWLPADGATGDLESFTPEGFRVQWLLEKREDGLRVGDLIVRAGGHTVDEWLQGAPRGPEWRADGVVTYEIRRDGQEMVLPIRLAPVPLQAILARWAPQLIVLLALWVVGTFVYWQRSQELSARLLMIICVSAAAQLLGDAYNLQYATLPWRWPFWLHLVLEQGTFSVSFASGLYLTLVFPAPHPLVKRFPRLAPLAPYVAFFLVISVAMLLAPTWSAALESGNRAALAMAVVQMILMLVLGARSAIVARDPIVRAQMRWIIWIVGVLGAVALPGYILPLALLGHPLVSHPVIMILIAGIPLSFAIAILRYRLWDIDIIINRTLVYGALTGILALVYLASVALLQQVFLLVTGQQSDLAIIVSTLVIAALFMPLQHRLQTLIDRRFYRAKVDFQEALLAFSRELRTIIDLHELLCDLVERVTDLLHIEHGLVFLVSADNVIQQVEECNLPSDQAQPPALSDVVLRRLRGGEAISRPGDALFPLLVPLLAPRAKERALVGVLALGPRLSGQGYSHDDQDLLLGLADQAGTAIYVAQLIEEKQAEVHRKEVAEAANVAKSEFVSLVSHELKTPMTSIRGYIEMLADGTMGPVNEDQVEFLNTIRSNVDRMSTLVADLSDISRIEAGRLRLECVAVPMSEVVDEVARSMLGQIEGKEQTLVSEIPADLPPVRGDRMRLVQVLTNLVSNAFKYTPQGGQIAIRAEQTSAGSPPVVHVAVQDNGIGISPEEQGKVFAKFFRSEDPAARRVPGTGLGLSIARYLVEMHGGRIWFESELHQGTTFHFTVPVADESI